jgi:cytoskeletal protein RodZ
MPTLGEELRRRREERGTSLADISEATRIGTRFLKAIESDNFSVLPGGIFTRSFIRAYAKQVGMSEDEAIALYQSQVTAQAGETPQQMPSPATTQPKAVPEQRPRHVEPVIMRQAATRTNWPTIVIAVGILLFIGIIVFALVKQLSRSTGEDAEQATGAPAVTQPSQQPAPTPQPTSGDASGQPTDPSAPPPAVTQGEPIKVKLEASGDSYVSYRVDAATKGTSILLKPGMSHEIPPAQEQVRLVIGNRTVLKLFINDREAAFPPDTKNFSAQVVISRDNLQAFFQ